MKAATYKERVMQHMRFSHKDVHYSVFYNDRKKLKNGRNPEVQPPGIEGVIPTAHWTVATENNECKRIHQHWGTVTTPLRKTAGCQVYGQSDTTENDIHRFGKRMYAKDTYKNVSCLTLEYVNYGQWLSYSLVHFWVGRCLFFIEQKLFY